jgi:hypothetical protein
LTTLMTAARDAKGVNMQQKRTSVPSVRCRFNNAMEIQMEG